MKVINELARVRNKCPESTITRRILIENLISNYRFDEAILEIKAFKKVIGYPYFIALFEGEIEFLKGNRIMAFDIWDKAMDSFNNDYRCFYGIAELYVGYAMYDKAIPLYWKSFSIQAKPRNIDGLISLYQIYEILDKPSEYNKVINQIIRVFSDD